MWYFNLPIVLLVLRTTMKEDFPLSPAELVYGQDLRLPGEFKTQNIIIIIIIFIYLPSDVISQEKTATSSRSITKASKYAIPLKPNTQNLLSQSDV